MKTNKNTSAKPEKHSGKRKHRSTNETSNLKAKKKRSEETIDEAKSVDSNSISKVSIRFSSRIGTNDPQLKDIDITNEDVKRVSVQSVIRKIFPDKNRDKRRSLVESVAKSSGIALEKYDVGRGRKSPKVMNVQQLKIFMEKLPFANTLSDQEKQHVFDFRNTDIYKKIVALLEDDTIIPAKCVQNSMSLVKMREWWQNLKTQIVDCSDEKFTLVQELLTSSYFPGNPTLQELYKVNKSRKSNENEGKSDENIKYVVFTNSSYCLNIDGFHESPCVCFVITPKGLKQRCFHQTASRGTSLCKDYHSDHIVPPYVTESNSIMMKLLSTGSKKNKDQKALQASFTPDMTGDYFFRSNDPNAFKRKVESFIRHRVQLLNISTGGVYGDDKAKTERESTIIEQYKLQATNIDSQKDEMITSEQCDKSEVVLSLHDKPQESTSEHEQIDEPKIISDSCNFVVSASQCLYQTQSIEKTVVFKDLQGDLRTFSGVSFASLISYITEVFVGKCVIKVTYDHVKFGEVAIKDESNYTMVPNYTTLTVHWSEQ